MTLARTKIFIAAGAAIGALGLLALSGLPTQVTAQTAAQSAASATQPATDGRNIYSGSASDKVSPALAGDLERIYVPNLRGNDVYVVDPLTLKVVDKFKVGIGPQHIVPSWDLRTLWVTNNA